MENDPIPGDRLATQKTSTCLQLDVRALQRGRHLSEHQILTWGWDDGSRACLYTRSDTVRLVYALPCQSGEWKQVDQVVSVARSACHYGGDRPWFSCLIATRRAAILYLCISPMCRKCAELVYPSQSESVITRSWRRTHRLEKQLFGYGKSQKLQRPKWMRWTTFSRLLTVYRHEQQVRDAALYAFIGRCRRGQL